MVLEPAQVTVRPVRTTPIGSELERPPFAPMVHVHRLLRGCEDERAGFEHARQCARIVLRMGCQFSEGDVASRVDKIAKLAIGDRRSVYPKSVHSDPVDRRLLRIVSLGTHPKSSAGDINHLLVCLPLNRWPGKTFPTGEIHFILPLN